MLQVSPLERAIQQATAVITELKSQNHPASQVLDVHKMLFGPPAAKAQAAAGAPVAPGGTAAGSGAARSGHTSTMGSFAGDDAWPPEEDGEGLLLM